MWVRGREEGEGGKSERGGLRVGWGGGGREGGLQRDLPFSRPEPRATKERHVRK